MENWKLFDFALNIVTSALSYAYDWASRILFAISPMGIGILSIGVLFWSLYRFIIRPFLGGESFERYAGQKDRTERRKERDAIKQERLDRRTRYKRWH